MFKIKFFHKSIKKIVVHRISLSTRYIIGRFKLCNHYFFYIKKNMKGNLSQLKGNFLFYTNFW